MGDLNVGEHSENSFKGCHKVSVTAFILLKQNKDKEKKKNSKNQKTKGKITTHRYFENLQAH